MPLVEMMINYLENSDGGLLKQLRGLAEEFVDEGGVSGAGCGLDG